MKNVYRGYLLLFFVLNTAVAQFDRPTIPPSPNVSAINRFSNIQVGYYTGVPSISIPLGVVPGKDISIPVSLDYHASGIKVQDIASSSGLGWVLNAGGGFGGSISRYVRGVPDGAKPRCASGTSNYWSNINEWCDGEQDIFVFSFMGRSGKMFLDNSGNVQTMPYMDIKVTPGVGPYSVGYWIITDENGYTYFFGQNPSDYEQTTYFTGNGTTYTEKYTYTSTWYLNKIVSPKGQDVATFTYNSGTNYEYLMYYQRGLKSGSSWTITDTNTKIRINQPKYLNTISTSVASVQFSYLNNRQDLENAWQLNTVTFRDQSGAVKQRYHLVLDYFVGDFGIPGSRLRLAEIKVGVSDPLTAYSFQYIGDNTWTPLRNQFKTDHSGYLNMSRNTSCVPSYRLPIGCTAYGISKEAGLLDEAQIFTLSKIHYASGARTEFEYESANLRGIRVKSISQYSGGASLVSKSSFSYAGVEGIITPVYSFTGYDGTEVWSSASFNNLFDLNGTNVGYSQVTETFLDGSKIIREFTNFSDFADTPPVVRKYLADPPNSTPSDQGAADVNGPPFASSTSKFWARGLPKRIRTYDAGNNLLKEDEMQYEEGPIVSSVSNTVLHTYQQTGGSNPKITYLSGVYNLVSQPFVLKQVNSKTYDQSNFSKYQEIKTTHNYHSIHRTFPVLIETSSISPGLLHNSVRQTFRYPIDLTGTGTPEPSNPNELAAGIWKLVAWHVITPVEKLTYVVDFQAAMYRLTGGELYTFRKNPITNRPLLKGIYTLNRANLNGTFTHALLTNNYTVLSYDADYRLLQSFDYNDNTSNVTSVTGSEGITTTFEYEPTSTFVSSDYISLGSTQFRNQYAYNSIYGLLSKTDANNNSTNYVYDNHGRLKLVKDNNDIVSRYRYNVKGISEFDIGITTSANVALTGQSVTISSMKNSEPAGVTKYIWDFGDGQVTEGTSTAVSHSYTNPGTYTIKLSKVNPEYGKLMTTKQVTIYSPVTVTIGGCNLIDLCAATPYCNLTAEVTGGCSSFNYTWYKRIQNGAWELLGYGSQTTFYPNWEGTFEIRCDVTDSTCGNSTESNVATIVVHKSDSNCAQH
jgi:YD repeat-containing protein